MKQNPESISNAFMKSYAKVNKCKSLGKTPDNLSSKTYLIWVFFSRILSDSVLTLQYIKASHNFVMLTRLFLKTCMTEHSIKWPKLVSSLLISTIPF